LGGAGLGVLGLLDPVDDPGQGGVGPDAGGQHLQEAATGDGAGEDVIGLGLLHRDRFAGDRGLVDAPGAGHDLAVDGDLGAVLDQHDLAHRDLIGRDFDLMAVPQHDRRIGSNGHQLGQC